MIKKTMTAAFIAAVALSACGGGGSSGSSGGSSVTPPPVVATTAEGMWSGTTSNGRKIQAVVLSDGTIWTLYTSMTNPNLIAGAYQGVGTSTNGSFAVATGLDFNLEGNGILATVLSGSYTAKSGFNGSVNYPTKKQTVTFTSKYMPEYDMTPSPETVMGLYSGSSAVKAGTDMASVAIDVVGNISGAAGANLQCRISGKITPRTKGNVYDVTVTFGTASCATPGGTVTGIAIFDAVNRRLYAAALNATKTDGLIFVGVKQ
jgi:hypothetical protein